MKKTSTAPEVRQTLVKTGQSWPRFRLKLAGMPFEHMGLGIDLLLMICELTRSGARYILRNC
jgi:hypothetical protein